MPDFHIGLSGLNVAQRALEVISTNIANASTEGYHRQDIQISALPVTVSGAFSLGGSEVKEVRRALDVLLETELLRQNVELGQASQELLTLRTVESAMGDLSSEGLNHAIGGFFDALTELAAEPDSRPLQEQVVWAGDILSKHFENLGQFLLELDHQILLEGQDLIERANTLAAEIADLNDEIHGLVNRGGAPNLLLDRRDQAIAELAELVEVQVDRIPEQPNVVNVIVWGTPLVVRNDSMELELGTTAGGELGVSVKDAAFYMTDLSGGRLGGLLALRNDILCDVEDRLDNLVKEIVYNVNGFHVEGVGSAGAFTELSGWPVSTGQLQTWTQWGAYLNAGTLHVRVADLDTGVTTRHAIDVAADDTVATLAAEFDALTGLNAGVTDRALRITASDTSRYRFDFRPVPVTTLQGGWSGTSAPTVTGIYTGAEDETYTATVVNGGTVGLTENLKVEVRNDAGELVRTLEVGLGYPAGDRLEVAEGLVAAFAPGTLTAGETFTVEALADADTSGFLAAAGINAFFRGDTLLDIAVDPSVMADPERVAGAAGADGTDNANVRRMAALGEQALPNLGSMSVTDYHRMIVTNVGQRITFSESRHTSLERMMQQLMAQRDRMSGVDINEEAGKLLVFERMYQALAKLISLEDQAMDTLMELV